MRMMMTVLTVTLLASPAAAQGPNLIPPATTGAINDSRMTDAPAVSEDFYTCVAGARMVRIRFFGKLRPFARAGRPITAQQQADIVGEVVADAETCLRHEGGERYNVRRMYDAILAAGPPPPGTPQR